MEAKEGEESKLTPAPAGTLPQSNSFGCFQIWYGVESQGVTEQAARALYSTTGDEEERDEAMVNKGEGVGSHSSDPNRVYIRERTGNTHRQICRDNICGL